MSDELLPYYSRELTYIREFAAEFARAHPAVAERLGLSKNADECKDPHVERMIESFAYLTGRIRRKLDDDFPELVNGVMGVLYPHYLAPIPSMAIAQITLDRKQAELTSGYTVEAGAPIEAPLTSGPHAGQACRFRTSYPVTAWPIEVASAKLGGLPFSAASAEGPPQPIACLQIELRAFSPEMPLSKLELPALRFYLNGQNQQTFPLYELILNNTVEVVIKTAPTEAPTVLGRAALKEVGLDAHEALMPYTPRSFPGYRLLSEYFAFPRKFLVFEINLGKSALRRAGRQAQLWLYLDRTNPDLEKTVTADTFRLGCTPIVNLFQRQADAVELDETRTEYRIEPDRRRRMAHEVYSVDKVMVSSKGQRPVEYSPFYSFDHATDRSQPAGFWYARRRPPRRNNGQIDRGTEVYLTLVDLNFNPFVPADRTMLAEITCTNRDLPQQLPWGGGQPRLIPVAGGPIAVECLTQPTATERTDVGRGAMWRLVSHLTLNHLSITGGAHAAEALREILRLYNFTGSPEADAKIAAVLDVNSRLVTSRAGGVGAGGICRGVQVTIRFDEDRFSDRGLFLFATVLEQFLALYCSVNSFSQLVATTNQREGILKRWPPRAGEQVLL